MSDDDAPRGDDARPGEIGFSAVIRRDRQPDGWTIVVVPESAGHFRTRRPVRVAGAVDGHPVEATLLPLGDGTHMLPLGAALRAAIGKGEGDEVTVSLRPSGS
ncbi:DUF1905 domain-containing protein [Leifsonia sp. NPDC058248]|uniref:DUF1905 domain-containing protein n=1 Tax=Leifsonia sp. NPDC058248 TaxID=3346402 RepID=UPI0036D7BD56